jgi:hypothetical protein
MFMLRIVTRMMGILMGMGMIMNGLPVPMHVRMDDDLSCTVTRAAVLRADLSRTSTFGTFFRALFFACHRYLLNFSSLWFMPISMVTAEKSR